MDDFMLIVRAFFFVVLVYGFVSVSARSIFRQYFEEKLRYNQLMFDAMKGGSDGQQTKAP